MGFRLDLVLVCVSAFEGFDQQSRKVVADLDGLVSQLVL